MNILDLFSGAGGLTEGFRRDEFNIIAHIEKNTSAYKTLLAREAFYFLKSINKLNIYNEYLKGNIKFPELMTFLPKDYKERVINEEISSDTLSHIFNSVDDKLQGAPLEGIIGGPPCQAYSTIARGRNEKTKSSDKRIYLYQYYTEFLIKYRPKFFIFENVKGLRSFKDIDGEKLFPKIINEFENAFKKDSYKVYYEMLNSADFKVPQRRERIILMGVRSDIDKGEFFQWVKKYKEPAPALSELFQDLPFVKNNDEVNYRAADPSSYVEKYINPLQVPLSLNRSRKNNDRDKEIYRIAVSERVKGNKLKYGMLPPHLKTHKNEKDFQDRFTALSYNDISHTIVAHIAKDGHYYIHPDVKQNRSITLREAARIQSFPDDFYFEDNRTAAFTQIGNAVPPLLSKVLAQAILDYIYA